MYPITPIVCPFCSRDIYPKHLKRVCSLQKTHVETKFNPLSMLNRGLACQEPGCAGIYTNRQCGHCRHELPPNIAQYDAYMRVGLVAPTGGGKTVLLTTMMEEIRNHSTALGLNIGAMDTDTSSYHDTNRTMLYERLKAPDGSPRGTLHPMQWFIQNARQSIGKPYTPTYSLTIHDGAGEDYSATDDKAIRHLTRSQMIILLLDPRQLEGVRKRMTSKELQQAGGANMNDKSLGTADFINRIIAYIKRSTGTDNRRKLSIPVAVVFAKMDMMKHLIPGDATIFQPSGHVRNGCFDESESQYVHTEVQTWLEECGDDLKNIFDSNFSTWRYFGVSSLGMPTVDGQTLKAAPQPLRVLDPLIWAMSLSGVYETRNALPPGHF